MDRCAVNLRSLQDRINLWCFLEPLRSWDTGYIHGSLFLTFFIDEQKKKNLEPWNFDT